MLPRLLFFPLPFSDHRAVQLGILIPNDKIILSPDIRGGIGTTHIHRVTVFACYLGYFFQIIRVILCGLGYQCLMITDILLRYPGGENKDYSLPQPHGPHLLPQLLLFLPWNTWRLVSRNSQVISLLKPWRIRRKYCFDFEFLWNFHNFIDIDHVHSDMIRSSFREFIKIWGDHSARPTPISPEIYNNFFFVSVDLY